MSKTAEKKRSKKEKMATKHKKEVKKQKPEEDVEPEVTDNVGVTHIPPEFICE